MICFMLFALFATGAADLSTDSANFLGILTVSGHEVSGQLADIRAVKIELDAASHHLHIIFAEARSSAGLAYDRTVATGLDA